MKAHIVALALMTSILAMAGCDKPDVESRKALSLVSCNEAAFLEPHLRRVAQKEGFALDIKYLAPQDMLLEVAKGQAGTADAVVAPSAEWLDLLEDKNVLSGPVQPIMTIPMTLAVRQGLAVELGLTPEGLNAGDLCRLAGDGKLPYLMASASQSAAGLAVYLGMVRALSGKTAPVGAKDLSAENDKEQLKRFFAGLPRSAGSHLWTKSLFETGAYPAMFNYQHVVRQAAHDALRDGGEPLVLVNIAGAQMAAHPVFAAIARKSGANRWCGKLRDYFDSQEFKSLAASLGREPADKQERQAWSREQLGSLLSLYQEELRKPSVTILVVELSGKMKGFAEREVKRAVRQALDPQLLKERFQQGAPKDQVYLLVYNERVVKSWRLDNLSEDQQSQIMTQFEGLSPQGKANPYTALGEAAAILGKLNLGLTLAQVILIPYETPSAPGKNLAQMKQQWQGLRREAPVQCVLFGETPAVRLDEIAEATRGRLFDGRTDLTRAVFAARAYND